jgi:hypothetical protein
MKAANAITYAHQLSSPLENPLPAEHPELTQRPGNESQHSDLRQVGKDEHSPQNSDRGEDGSEDDGEERLHQVWVCKASE